MRQRFLTLSFASLLLVAACVRGGTGSDAPSRGEGGASGAPPDIENAFDPASISGDVSLGTWASSPAEVKALRGALADFSVKYPNIKVTQTAIPGDYRSAMVRKFGASDVPDLFSIKADYAQDWMNQGFLQPLDDYIQRQGFDTSKFFPDYVSIFQQDGVTYGLPMDANTIAMAVNTDLVPTPPTTMDELLSVAQGLKGRQGLKAPMCLNPALDRGLAFIYAQGGSLLDPENSASAIDSTASRAAVQWYMDLFKNELGKSSRQLGDSGCGEALGKGDVAIAFEGGWLKDTMAAFPKVKWQFAEMPTGSSGTKVTISSAAAYGIGVDGNNKDQAWVLMQYLTGPEGMAKWTEGGIAVPSRSDVTVPTSFEVIVRGADYAKPGSGFMPGYPEVQKAFDDAFLKQVTDKSFDAGPVVTATKARIDSVLAAAGAE
jgi:multiple sugar transport system substrate-binding protein